jgi:hypothetical protein
MRERVSHQNTRKIWTKEEATVMRNMAARGCDDLQIGDHLNRHHTSVYNKRIIEGVDGQTYKTGPTKAHHEKKLYRSIAWPTWARFSNISRDEARVVRAAAGVL